MPSGRALWISIPVKTPTHAIEAFDIYDTRWLDDPRDLDDRERDFDRDLDPRDHDARESFVEGLELPHGHERERVQDDRENLYELNGEDSRMLAEDQPRDSRWACGRWTSTSGSSPSCTTT